MESTICAFCKKIAKYSCSCTVNFCYDHQKHHDSLLGDHKATRIKLKYRIANPIAKMQLIEKITQVKNQAHSQIHSLLQDTNKCILDIKKQLQKTFKQIKGFIKLCDSVIIEIHSINNIGAKEFYTPLENALLSFNIEPMLNLINPPLIKISQNNFKINYVPSTFPHYFYNYSDYTIEFNSINSIQIFPFNNNIKNDNFIQVQDF